MVALPPFPPHRPRKHPSMHPTIPARRRRPTLSLPTAGLLFCMASCMAACAVAGAVRASEPLPTFAVPGHEPQMQRLNALYALHHGGAFSDCTLWDPWLPHATLWTGREPVARYRASLLRRRIDSEGYVAMQQHRGMAHSDGWPFPAWQQSTGSGWHFSVAGDEWGVQQLGLKALQSAAGWEIEGATAEGIDPGRGLLLKATADSVTITTPPLHCGTIVAPFVRLEWGATDLPAGAAPRMEWQLEGEAWQPAEGVAFPAPPADGSLVYANVPLYRQPGYAGIVTRYRIAVPVAAGASISLKSVITAIDSRHPITNSLFLRASCETFLWTHDIAFLRDNLPRMRQALAYALAEFRVRETKHVHVPWVGHDGRSGLELTSGEKKLLPGLGVGNNYWDLLPFGGDDALATIYLTDALDHLAAVEEGVAAHPEWNMPADPRTVAAAELRRLASDVRADFQTRFWNRETGRFNGWIDGDGRAYDYGFTFVNLEAISYSLATPEQAKDIFAWLDGQRIVAGDTSQGADIYHWRCAPRATTRRNIETYAWMWSGPETIPWGGQVQDGGAVLGFSYFDLMARLTTLGPDNAWQRLEEILKWFAEVQGEGGYRRYYSATSGRGTLQGGGTAGGLGLDEEFMESVLVPQVMLYGFLGFQPTVDGCTIAPRLPSAWPELSVVGILIHDQRIDVAASRCGGVTVRRREAGTHPLAITCGGTTHVLRVAAGASVVFPVQQGSP